MQASPLSPLPFENARREFQTELVQVRRSWGWFLASGLVLILLGAMAVTQSAFTTVVTVTFLGWMLTLGGVVAVAHSFSLLREGFGHFFGQLLTGLLYLVAGVLFISTPGATALAVTFLLTPLFMIGGIVRVISAAGVRPPQWGWTAMSGVLAALFGAMIWAQWPVSGLWLIGTYVGVEMLVYGWATVMFALALKRLPILAGA